MLLALQHPDRWEQNVAIREWVDVNVSHEFRGFVKNGVLTAVSQYNHLVAFPSLLEDDAGACNTAHDAALSTSTSTAATDRACEWPRGDADGAGVGTDAGSAHVKAIADRLTTFFYTKCRDQLASKFADYVIDFAITDRDEVVVIELNPFLETTDGCLFSWTKERELIEGTCQGDGGARNSSTCVGDDAATTQCDGASPLLPPPPVFRVR
jgi:hypothetical protein